MTLAKADDRQVIQEGSNPLLCMFRRYAYPLMAAKSRSVRGCTLQYERKRAGQCGKKRGHLAATKENVPAEGTQNVDG